MQDEHRLRGLADPNRARGMGGRPGESARVAIWAGLWVLCAAPDAQSAKECPPRACLCRSKACAAEKAGAAGAGVAAAADQLLPSTRATPGSTR